MKRLVPMMVLVCLLTACAGQSQNKTDEAGRLLQNEEYAAAEKAFADILSTDAENAEAWWGRGKARLMQAQFESALVDMNKSVELATAQKAENETLGKYHFERGFTNYLWAKYGSAKPDFEKAIALGYDLGNSWAYFGASVGNTGDDIAAIQALDKAVELDPGNHFAWTNRGYYNSKVGDNKTAIFDLSKAIELIPEDKVSYLNRGYTYIGMGDYQTAIKDFEKALEIDPEYMGALAYMGISLTNTSRPEEALAYLDKAIAGTPDNPTLYYYRGVAYINVNRRDEGCKDLIHALENGDDQGLSLIEEFCNK